MGQMLVLTRRQVEQVLSVQETTDLVEACFRALGDGTGENLPTASIRWPEISGRCNIKSGYLKHPGAVGIKIIRTHNKNPERHGLPVKNAQIVVLDSDTGLIQAIMDGDYITEVRTGSSGAVGARWLARPEAKRVAMIGAGIQGRAQLEALARDRALGDVWVWSRTAERRETYAREMSQRLGLTIRPTGSIEEAVRQAEIIITATWAYEVLVQKNWVQPGTYIGAIGADAPGMQELDPAILLGGKVVIDDLEQCVRMGEINVPVKAGLYRVEQLHGTIGEVIAGKKPGRTSADEITIFDSTGVGVQDAVCAIHAYQKARELGLGTWVDI